MILDTSVVIKRVRERRIVQEDITVVTIIEFPRVAYYSNFRGKIIFPKEQDFLTAHELQLQLAKMGSMQAFSDLLIASIAINRGALLETMDRDFLTIAKAAKLLGMSLEVKMVE